VLNGTYAGHRAVEDALKDFYGMEHAMVFSTGYQANLGIISTVAGKGDYIVLDIDSHASIWDGCKMGDAEVVPFKHNDIVAMEKRLKRIPEGAGKLVVLEGVYSMLGDIAPLKEMIAIAKENGAMVLVDEAHSMGFIGPNGRGVAEEQGVLDDVDFVIGTFSKSVGTVGGFCVSNHPKFEILRLVCRPYVFTASLPPSVVHTAATSIRKLMHAADKRAHLWENSRTLHKGLRDRGFQLGTEEPQSAIISVIMPDLERGAGMGSAAPRRAVREPGPPAGNARRDDAAALLAVRGAHRRTGADDHRHVRTRRQESRDHLTVMPGRGTAPGHPFRSVQPDLAVHRPPFAGADQVVVRHADRMDHRLDIAPPEIEEPFQFREPGCDVVALQDEFCSRLG
jgi:glycine C-acetyltransferase/8-amino-7-oxononanoate synthase